MQPNVSLMWFGRVRCISEAIQTEERFGSDICDRNLDLHVERCKTRPLPAGMISVREAKIAFAAWLLVTVSITYLTLGVPGVLTCIPIWTLSAIYPFMKRLIPFPQLVLGPTIGSTVFPGWVSVSHSMNDIHEAIPLFLATTAWVVYFDTFYAVQVSWLTTYPLFRLTFFVSFPLRFLSLSLSGLLFVLSRFAYIAISRIARTTNRSA